MQFIKVRYAPRAEGRKIWLHYLISFSVTPLPAHNRTELSDHILCVEYCIY